MTHLLTWHRADEDVCKPKPHPFLRVISCIRLNFPPVEELASFADRDAVIDARIAAVDIQILRFENSIADENASADLVRYLRQRIFYLDTEKNMLDQERVLLLAAK